MGNSASLKTGAAGRSGHGFPAADPRTVIICAIVLSLWVACLNSFAASVAALAIAVILALLLRPPFFPLLKSLLAANVFILFIWLLVPWTTPGTVIGHWWLFAFTRPGVELCLLVTIKGNALVLIFLTLVAPMPVTSLANALRRLHCPEKLTWLFLLMGRNVHLLRAEWQRMAEAARLRGFQPANSRRTYLTYASMLAILLTRCQDRAERMREAMLLRGFTGKLPPGPLLRYSLADAFIFFLLLLCLCLLTWMELGHGF